MLPRKQTLPGVVRAPEKAAAWMIRLLRFLPGGHALAIIDQAVVSEGTFLAVIVIGRWSDPQQLGEYAVGMTVIFSLAGTQEALIGIPYTVRRSRAERNPRTLADGALLQAVGLATVATLGLLLAGAAGSLRDGGHDFARMAAVLGILAPCLFLRDFARQVSFAHGRVGYALTMDVVATTLQVGGMAWLGACGSLAAATAYLANAAAFGVAATGWLVLRRRWFRFRFRRVRQEVGANIALGRWLVAAQAAVSVQGFVASWLLALISGAHAAGIYAACMTLVAVANPVVVGCSNLLLPRTAMILRRDGAPEMARRLVGDAYVLGAFLACFWLVLWVGSDHALGLLFRNPDYHGQDNTIRLLGLALLATAVSIPASNGLTCLGRPQAVFWATLGSATTNATLSLLLIPSWDVAGAACGFLAGSVVGAIGRWAALAWLPELRSAPSEAQARDVLRPFEAGMGDGTGTGEWTLRPLGQGKQGWILGASRSEDGQPDRRRELVVKLYRPAMTRAAVRAQFDALRALHSVLNGRVLGGWRIMVPTPLLICDAPLALVMTRVPGRSLWHSLASPAPSDAVEVGCVVQAIARAMAELWSAGQTYGDLNVDNVLCDPASRTLSFLDPGNPSQMLYEAWTSPSQDLAYFVFESSTSLRRAISHPRAEAQLRLVTADVVRAVLSDIPLLSERRRLLEHMRDATQDFLGTLESSWTPRGLWRSLVRQVGLRRIASLTAALQTEIELVAVND